MLIDSLLKFATLFAVVATVAWWCTGRLISFLTKIGNLDVPNERSLHQGQIPRGGGLVIVGLLVIAMLVMAIASGRYSVLIGMALLLSGWAVIGWLDDRHNLNVKPRLLTQAILAVLTILLFGHVAIIDFGGESQFYLAGAGLLLTFLGILWLSNLYNFMDGMDGLAASQSLIAALTIGFWFLRAGDWSMAVCCFVLAAACYGFLLHNWKPASIFLGDVGSIAIGAFFATLVIYGVTRHQISLLSFFMLFAVFIGDATVTLVSRGFRKQKVWQAHKEHFYQRLAACGIAHDKIVVALIMIMLICAMISSLTILDHDRIPLGGTITMLLLFMSALIVVMIERRKVTKAD